MGNAVDRYKIFLSMCIKVCRRWFLQQLPAVLQAVITPSVLTVTETLTPMTFTLALTAAPSQDVHVTITSPSASWNPSQALGSISPSTLTFTGANWSNSGAVTISPANISIGNWFLNVTYR